MSLRTGARHPMAGFSRTPVSRLTQNSLVLFLFRNPIVFVGVALKRKLFWHIFRAGLYGRAGRRPVGPVKIGGFPGPERLLISTSHRVQFT